jgi:aminoglycoside phosphotransferase (APT) family kinase protein
VAYESLTHDVASAVLAQLGVNIEPSDLILERRDAKWLVRLSGNRFAWFAASEAGHVALLTERRVLRLLTARCTITVPRVLEETSDGSVDVRLGVPGVHDAFAVFRRALTDPEAAARIGSTLGAVVAEVHKILPEAEAVTGLPLIPTWPEPIAWIRERLPRVVDDNAVHEAADAVLRKYEDTIARVPNHDRALVHSDLGLHNISIDPVELTVFGIFDWEGACWADRHLDFRYLTFGSSPDVLLDAAISGYERATNHRLDRSRIYLYNAASAISYLAFRDGVPPNEQWCGRTLAEDVAWVKHALARLEP